MKPSKRRTCTKNFERQSKSIEYVHDQVVLLDHSRYEKLEGRLARTWLVLDKNRHGDRVEVPILWNFNHLTAREGLEDEKNQWPTHD